jgi:CheY-like chemotaxis protein/anti-sigma regulatory factor (Ser/Thr protein kinase)
MPGETILVVDDDNAFRAMVRAVLEEREEYRVREASDGIEAMEALETALPALVLTDLRMPRMGGLELLRSVRQRLPSLPVIVISGVGMDDEVVQCLQEGAIDFLRKPFPLQRLAATVRDALLRQQSAPGQEWHYEKSGWLELTADSAFETIARFRTCVERLTETSVAPDMAEELRFAIEELGRNAVEWGNRGEKGKRVQLSYCLFGEKIMFKIEDEGTGFNPASVPDPSVAPQESLHQREEQGKRVGGFGIHLVRKLMDEVIYNERGNVVVMTKHLSPVPGS